MSQVVVQGIAVAAYLGLNFALNFGNKRLLVSFHFPIFVILVGTLFYLPLAALLIRLGVSSFPSSAVARRASRELLLIGAVHAVGTAAQNWSLAGVMSVGLNQVIKASTPAVTLAATWLLQGVRYHWSLVAATALVVAGSGLTVYTSADATVAGVLLCVASSVFGGLEGVLTANVMRNHDLHPVQTSFLIGLPAAVTLLAPFFVFEFSGAFLDALWLRGMQISGFIMVLSMFAAAYSYVHFWLIAALGAHYCNLIGSIKLVLIVAVSFLIIDASRKLSWLNLAGIALTLAGFAAYSVLRMYFTDMKSKGEVESLPVAAKAAEEIE